MKGSPDGKTLISLIDKTSEENTLKIFRNMKSLTEIITYTGSFIISILTSVTQPFKIYM